MEVFASARARVVDARGWFWTRLRERRIWEPATLAPRWISCGFGEVVPLNNFSPCFTVFWSMAHV